jgi:hypothetical protein
MARLRVHRSPLRQFLLGIAGLLLLLAAIEVVIAHRITLEPETDDQGRLTARGESRRTQDVVVGTTFFLAGGALIAVALAGLANSRPVAEVEDDEIRLRILGLRDPLRIGWEEILEVRSAREPGDGLHPRPLLLLLLADPVMWPEEFWGARRDGQWLVVDAETWNKPPEEVVMHARLAMETWHRDHLVQPDDAD